MSIAMKSGWFAIVLGNFDPHMPGIYEWRIPGVGVYIGKAGTLSKRIRAYPNNVRRMLLDLPWHGNPHKQYRLIHRALKWAYAQGILVEVVILENCESGNRAERERYWINKRAHEAAKGGPPLLNSGYWDNSKSFDDEKS